MRPVVTAPAAPVRSAGAHAHETRVRANRRRVVTLCGGTALVPALVVGLVVALMAGAVAGAVAGVCVLVALTVVFARRSLPMALSAIGGRALAADADPALSNMVEGLCATIGVGMPDLWVVDDPVRNACALAGPSGRSVLVLTDGLRRSLGLIEMEGVVAHELVHLRSHDARVSAVAVATAGRLGRMLRDDRLLHAAVGRGREFRADRDAVLAVRYPPGLHDALAAMRQSPPPASASVFTGGSWSATRWVWIDPMVGAVDRDPVGEVDATDVRMEALAEW